MKKNNIWTYIKNYKADSLFFRNLLLILLMFLIPFIVMGAAYYRNVEKIAKDKIKLENSVIIYEVRDVVDTIISEFDSMCSYVANDSSVQMFMINDWFVNLDTGTSADLFRSLNMTKYVYSYVDSIYVYSEYNDAVINDNKMTALSEFDDVTWLEKYKILEDRRGITIARSEGGVYPLVISIIKPIYLDNEKKGAVIFNINSSKLYNSVTKIKYEEEQNIFLVNNEGKIIMTGDDRYFGKPVAEIEPLSDVTEDMEGFIREIDGKKCWISSVSSDKFDFFYINISPGTTYFRKINELKVQIAMLIGLVLVLSVALAYIVALKNYQPVTEIISVLDNPDNFDVSGNLAKFNELRYISKSIIERTKENELIQQELQDKLKKLKTAQLDMLQAQINPHFLYNTLETINWMAVDLTKSRNNVSTAVSNLAKFFRFNVNNGDYLIPIREEVERTRYYINILELRYGDMFTVMWNIDEHIMDYLMAKICLQPLIENAVYHGLKPKESKGRLVITGVETDAEIKFVIADDGVGMSREKCSMLNERLADDDALPEGHIGLYNINKRLKIIFGEEYGIKVDSEPGKGTKISVIIPKIQL